jgi:AraC-like DNA-binding protein
VVHYIKIPNHILFNEGRLFKPDQNEFCVADPLQVPEFDSQTRKKIKFRGSRKTKCHKMAIIVLMKKEKNNPFILALRAYNLTVEIHHHSAYQIVLSNDTPFTSTINGQLCERIHGFLIKPHVPHFCIAEKGSLNVLNIEPYSNVGLELAGRFDANQDYIVFDSPTETNIFFRTGKDTFDINFIINALIAEIPAIHYDERVTKIVEYIKENYFKQDINPRTLADIVFLSPSRLASLFKQQTGSSLSKYLLWTRLRQVIYLALSQKERSLTDIAYDTGFYDLPQLNKYMYEMFGMPPKALKYSTDLIQIY